MERVAPGRDDPHVRSIGDQRSRSRVTAADREGPYLLAVDGQLCDRAVGVVPDPHELAVERYRPRSDAHGVRSDDPPIITQLGHRVVSDVRDPDILAVERHVARGVDTAERLYQIAVDRHRRRHGDGCCGGPGYAGRPRRRSWLGRRRRGGRDGRGGRRGRGNVATVTCDCDKRDQRGRRGKGTAPAGVQIKGQETPAAVPGGRVDAWHRSS